MTFGKSMFIKPEMAQEKEREQERRRERGEGSPYYCVTDHTRWFVLTKTCDYALIRIDVPYNKR